MKKKLFLGLLAAAAVSFTACQKDEVISEMPQDNAIGFGTYVGRDAQTKATSINNAASLQTASTTNGFGVFAYYTENSSWDGESSKFNPNFMNNINVKYNTDWTYNPLRYWPKSGNDVISFLAYYPYKEGTVLKSTKEGDVTTYSTKIDFELNDNIKEQVDLMYHSIYENTDNLNNGVQNQVDDVSFNFAHALSRIGFKVTTGNVTNTNTNITINKVTLSFTNSGNKGIYTSGELDIKAGTWACVTKVQKDFVWSATTETNAGSFNTNTVTVGNSIDQLNHDDSYLMIPPVNEAKYTITVNYSVKTDNGATVNNTYTSDENEITLQSGKAYTFVLNIGLTAITFEAVVSIWEDPAETTVNVR